MRLKSLTFEDKGTGWRLEDLKLDSFNLLVGASGVGKTRILLAILALNEIGRTGNTPSFNHGVRFDARFDLAGHSYTWQFESAARAADSDEGSEPEGNGYFIVKEHLSVDGEKKPLVERMDDQFLFKGKALPLLNRSVSALLLLEEPVIEQLKHAFAEQLSGVLGPPRAALVVLETPSNLTKRFPTIEALSNRVRLNPIAKAFVLQEGFPDKFNDFKQRFIDIFPTVEDVSVSHEPTERLAHSSKEVLAFVIKERGTSIWIAASDISSGMGRTLHHIADLMLAPAGTVLLIDEFENSLGVNCMGPLTDLILSRANELQFIITSHHPYIINNIPKDYWKIVRRKGSTVRVTPASEIAALQGPSSQDDFIRLLNSPEFEEGLG